MDFNNIASRLDTALGLCQTARVDETIVMVTRGEQERLLSLGDVSGIVQKLLTQFKDTLVIESTIWLNPDQWHLITDDKKLQGNHLVFYHTHLAIRVFEELFITMKSALKKDLEEIKSLLEQYHERKRQEELSWADLSSNNSIDDLCAAIWTSQISHLREGLDIINGIWISVDWNQHWKGFIQNTLEWVCSDIVDIKNLPEWFVENLIRMIKFDMTKPEDAGDNGYSEDNGNGGTGSKISYRRFQKDSVRHDLIWKFLVEVSLRRSGFNIYYRLEAIRMIRRGVLDYLGGSLMTHEKTWDWDWKNEDMVQAIFELYLDVDRLSEYDRMPERYDLRHLMFALFHSNPFHEYFHSRWHIIMSRVEINDNNDSGEESRSDGEMDSDSKDGEEEDDCDEGEEEDDCDEGEEEDDCDEGESLRKYTDNPVSIRLDARLWDDVHYVVEQIFSSIDTIRKLESMSPSSDDMEELSYNLDKSYKGLQIMCKLLTEGLVFSCYQSQQQWLCLQPEILEKMTIVLDYLVYRLTGKKSRECRMKRYSDEDISSDLTLSDFRPIDWLALICQLYGSIHRTLTARGVKNIRESWYPIFAKDQRSFSVERFKVWHQTLWKNHERINISGWTVWNSSTTLVMNSNGFGEYREGGAGSLDYLGNVLIPEIEIYLDNTIDYNQYDPPEKFCDPLLMTLMTDPVKLPDGGGSSSIWMDREVIQKHLIDQSCNPFTRALLTLEQLDTENRKSGVVQERQELLKMIEEWKCQVKI